MTTLFDDTPETTDIPEVPHIPEVPERFTPDTPDKVDFVLGLLADRRARAARVRENAEKIATAAERECEHLMARFGADLRAFTEGQLAQTPRVKSVRLLNGVLGFRTKPQSIAWDKTQDAEMLAWAKANAPAAVVVKESVSLTVLKGALAEETIITDTGAFVDTATGEVLSFAVVAPAEETFYVR